jgi:hypothetical protein
MFKTGGGPGATLDIQFKPVELETPGQTAG